MSSQTIEQMIEGYFLSTTKAIGILFRERLLPHSLIVIYSTIDTCGLLDAPSTQTVATGASFKEWVKKYVLVYPGLEFNEIDLWAARCARPPHFHDRVGSVQRRKGAGASVLYGR